MGMKNKSSESLSGQAYYERIFLLDKAADMLGEKRVKKELTLKQVAGKVGVALNTVWRWENKEKFPRDPDVVSALGKLYDLNEKEMALLAHAAFGTPKFF